MRSLGTRRVAQAAGAAMVAVVALAGCSAGQVAETANLKTPISGLNTQSADGSLLIRNLQVVYNDPKGYPAGGSAPVEVTLLNPTRQPIVVTITGGAPQDGAEGIVSAQQVVVGPASGAGSGPASEPASAAPAQASARFTIAPLSSESFLPGDTELLQATGLSQRLVPGLSLALSIQVSTSDQPVEVVAPFAVPMSPASRAPGLEHEGIGEE